MKHRRLTPLILFLLLAACTRELPPALNEDGPLRLQPHTIPSIINPGGVYTAAVRLLGGKADSVRLTILGKDQSPLMTLGLFDDGGAVRRDSGDQVAFDGIYTGTFQWTAAAAGEVDWKFEAVDRRGIAAEPLLLSVPIIKNSPPQLLAVEAPDSLPSGFAGTLRFSASVSDSNGREDVLYVRCTGSRTGAASFVVDLLPEPEDDRFGLLVDRTFAVAKKGDYSLLFQAVDRSGARSNAIERRLFIGNNSPRLVEFSHVDSVALPPVGMMTAFLIAVRVEDDQTLADVKSVQMEWKKPDGTYSKNSPFTLFDNGLPWNEDFTGWDDGWRGDKTAGDGVYSITAIFDPSQPLGDYELTFWAEDLAGNVSSRETRIVTLYAKTSLQKTSLPLRRHPFEGK